MSLLMEALRKAEEAKRKSQEQESTPDQQPTDIEAAEPRRASPLRSAFALEPREPHPTAAPPPPVTPPSSMPSPSPVPVQEEAHEAVVIETPHDEVQDYLAADAVPEENIPVLRAGQRTRGTRQSRDQLAAASVFAAKQSARGDTRKKNRLMILLGAGFATTISGGAVLWYLQSMPGSGMAINPGIANYDLSSRGFLDEQAPAAVPVAAVEEVAAVADPTVLASAPQAAAPGTEPASAADTTLAAAALADAGSIPPDATGAAPTIAPADEATLAAAAFADSQPQQPTIETPVITPAPPATAVEEPQAAAIGAPRTLEISRSTSRPVVNSTLQSAWNALQAGELQTATLLYEEVLAELPNDRDALIGLASIQLRNGQAAEARQSYARLLTLNPQDPYARAGLLQASQATSDPAHETELKNLLQRYPELPPLHFALGNFYAGQQRWSEAQGAYFDALLHANRDSATPVSPDYAFNLAVSLEQLQQPEAALNYYSQALELSRSSPAGFDLSLLQSRLGTLQQRMQE
jgi:tetratricopeptide (TPR) repeat protein